MKQSISLFIVLAVGALFGCKSGTSTPESQTYTGTTTTIGTGTANSWAITDASGNLTSIGVTVSDAALLSLGSMDTEYEVPIPSGLSSPLFKRITLDYATMDAAPYNKPHLDGHFWMWDLNQSKTIPGGPDTVMPRMITMPADYMSMGGSEPGMGVHWMDMNTPEASGGPFRTAFTYGFSKGSMVFMEEMCSVDSLRGHMSYIGTVKRPTMMSGMTMLIPKTYSVTYNAGAKNTSIILGGFSQ